MFDSNPKHRQSLEFLEHAMFSLHMLALELSLALFLYVPRASCQVSTPFPAKWPVKLITEASDLFQLLKILL